jgi:hypothetical protein
MVRGVNYLFLGLALSILCFSFISASEFGVEIGKDRASTTTISTITFSGNLTNFTDLQDTPNSYVGNGLDCLRVNAGETAVEFFACAGGGDFSFTDFAGAFNSNFTGKYDNQSWNKTYADTLYSAIGASGGDFYWANFSGSFNSNISQIAYGNFNFSNFQSSFNLNSSYLLNKTTAFGDFNISQFQSSFDLNSSYLLNKTTAYGNFNISQFANSFQTNISDWEARVNASYLAGGGDFYLANFSNYFILNISNWETRVNSTYLSTYNSTYHNLLNQECPAGQVVNGTYVNGSFTCVTSGTGSGDFYLANFSNYFTLNISSWETKVNASYLSIGGNFNISQFQSSFNLNSTYLLNTSLFATSFQTNITAHEINVNASYLSTYNSTYNNLLNQMCAVGKVVNGTYLNGSLSCITDSSGGGSLWATNGTSIYNATVSQVGIGTTTPTHTLNVVGNTNLSGSLWAGNSTLFVNTSSVGIGTTAPAYSLEISNNAKALNVSGMLYVNSNSVGIGTATLTHTLNVVGTMNITGNSIYERNLTLSQANVSMFTAGNGKIYWDGSRLIIQVT